MYHQSLAFTGICATDDNPLNFSSVSFQSISVYTYLVFCFIYKEDIGHNVKSLAKLKVSTSGWSAWFSAHKSVLTLDDILVLHMFGHVFQNFLLHHLPRDQDEAGQPITPWVSPSCPYWTDICSLLVLSNHTDLSKIISGLKTASASSLSTFGCILSSSMELCTLCLTAP